MKSSNEIISHIISAPSMKKINSHYCFEKIKSLLPKHLSSAVLFMYQKNDTLFFVLNHPGIKMEFNYKVTLIKSLLNKVKEIDKKCANLEIKEIKSFVSNKIKLSPPASLTIPIYKERAKGDFENLAKDEEIRKIIEQIREEIYKSSSALPK